MRVKSLILFVLALCQGLLVRGQAYCAFTSDNGLSSTLINCLYQDSRGDIWVGTEDGLNRYDGSKITVYRNSEFGIRNSELSGAGHSLTHNYVRAIHETRGGVVLVGTYDGVQVYDPLTDSFSEVAKFVEVEEPNNYVTNFMERRNGEVWVMGNLMCKLNADSELSYELLDLPIPTTLIETAIEDKRGRIWVTRENDAI